MRVVMIDPGAYTPFHDDALCRALADAGADVELVTAPFVYHSWPEVVGYERREVFAGGAGGAGGAERARGRAGLLLRGGRRLRRALLYPVAWRKLAAELVRRPPDIVHLQWSLLPAVERRALRRLRAAGVAVVQTVHNPRPRGGEGALLAARRRLHAEADALVALSEFAGRCLCADERARGGRVRVIPPGISAICGLSALGGVSRVSAVSGAAGGPAPDRAAARARLGIAAGEPIALFLGLIRRYKGLDLLFEAFAEVLRGLPAARLVVAGLPRHSFRPYSRQIERLGIGERVQTDLRYLPQTVMEDYLAAADLVVLPYRDASQSAVLGAALAHDRPVVASAAGGLPEMLLGDAEAAREMLVPAGDVPALARAMSRLLGEREAAAELGRRAGSAARAKFTWSKAAASTLDLYLEVWRELRDPARARTA